MGGEVPGKKRTHMIIDKLKAENIILKKELLKLGVHDELKAENERVKANERLKAENERLKTRLNRELIFRAKVNAFKQITSNERLKEKIEQYYQKIRKTQKFEKFVI